MKTTMNYTDLIIKLRNRYGKNSQEVMHGWTLDTKELIQFCEIMGVI